MSWRERESGGGGRLSRRPAVVGDVLGRVAAVLRAETDVRDLLGELASISLELTGADRVSVFLLEDERLSPVVAIGKDPDGRLGAFHAMPPIEVDRRRAAALLTGTTVTVTDAATDPLVPRAWVDIFALESLVLVPVLGDGEPRGLIALDWQDAAFARDDLRLVEAVASYAGAAIAAIRRSAMAARSERLHDAARRAAVAITRAGDAGDVARAVLAGSAAILDERVRAVAVVDAAGGVVTTLREGAEPVTEPAAAGVAEAIAEILAAGDPHQPGWLADLVDGSAPGVQRSIVVPLAAGDATTGAVVIACRWRGPLDADELAAVRAVADTAAAALVRIRDDLQRAQGDLREVAGQLLGALSLLARHHAEVLPPGSPAARQAARLADLARAGRWTVEDALRLVGGVPGADGHDGRGA